MKHLCDLCDNLQMWVQPLSLGRVTVTQATANEGIRSDCSMASVPNENCNDLFTILSYGESLVVKMMSVW